MFKKTRVKNEIADKIEVGFSRYGPTLAVSGTLTALSQVAFVYSMSLFLTKKSSQMRREFTWFGLRPFDSVSGNMKGIDLNLPSKFTISREEPYPYNMIFLDQTHYDSINFIVKRIKNEWTRFAGPQDASREDKLSRFKKFKELKTVKSLLNEMEGLSYWQPGDYNVMIEVSTSQEGKGDTVKKSFSLGADEVKNLEQNLSAVVDDLCLQKDVRYQFVYPGLI